MTEYGENRNIINLSKALVSIIPAYLFLQRIATLNSEEVVNKYGDRIKKGLQNATENATQVMVCARNEKEALPKLLLSLSVQDVRILLVDNGSSDGTGALARSFGVEVVNEPTDGLSNALIRGFTHISPRVKNDQIRQLLLTDADSFSVPTWRNNMILNSKSLLKNQPGIIDAPVVFSGPNMMLNIIRTTLGLGRNMYYFIEGYANACGANGIIQFDSEGRIIEALIQQLVPNVIRGNDEMVQDTVVSVGGRAKYNWDPGSWMITDASKYTSISQIVHAFLNPNSQNFYSQTKSSLEKRIQYRSPHRPKILKY